jgi:hypothetical protein
MSKKIGRILTLVCICAFCINITGCNETTQQQSSSGAEQVRANHIPKNSQGMTVEQQNINDRIKVTTNPTKVMWIHLISLDGNIIKRMPIRNKVTSSGKRLEPRHAAVSGNDGWFPSSGIPRATNPTYTYETDELLQPDGTYGESDPYIFWFDPMGRYHQWGTAGGLGYLLTDYPIDLDNPIDKITGLYKVQEEALKWQKAQEEQLKNANMPKKADAPASSPSPVVPPVTKQATPKVNP